MESGGLNLKLIGALNRICMDVQTWDAGWRVMPFSHGMQSRSVPISFFTQRPLRSLSVSMTAMRCAISISCQPCTRLMLVSNKVLSLQSVTKHHLYMFNQSKYCTASKIGHLFCRICLLYTLGSDKHLIHDKQCAIVIRPYTPGVQ